MAIGAGIGGIAGLAVYGAKVLFSKERTWSWKDAGAHALGGVVGGGLFPPILAGLAAAGVPAAGAYVLAGGISWGGIWTLAQDGASWALGRRDGLGPPKKYLVATAIGLAVSALLLPIASRVITPAHHLRPHAGTAEAYLSTPVGSNIAKAEGEFLAFGALSEAGSALVRPVLTRAGNAAARPALSAGGAAVRGGSVEALTPEDPYASPPPPWNGATPLPWRDELGSPFGAWADGIHTRWDPKTPLDSEQMPGAVAVLEACHDE